MKHRWIVAAALAAHGMAPMAQTAYEWNVARQMLERMRGADFAIEAGAPYFAFMRELLVFLVALTDRIAAARLAPADRALFTVAFVRHLARTLEGN